MTLHIGKNDYFCAHCGIVFIPFGNDPICPNCGKEAPLSLEYKDFISQCASSLKNNKRKFGNYQPGAWYVSHFSDFVQDVLFMMFDLIAQSKPSNVQEYALQQWVDVQWEPYQKRHIVDIFERVYKEMGYTVEVSAKTFTVCHETFEIAHFPNIFQMHQTSSTNLERQLRSIADAWHEGSIVSAAQALESDLERR